MSCTTSDGAYAAQDGANDVSTDTRGAARILGLATEGLAAIRRRGGGPPYYRIGSRAIRYRLADVRAWIAARTVGGGVQ